MLLGMEDSHDKLQTTDFCLQFFVNACRSVYLSERGFIYGGMDGGGGSTDHGARMGGWHGWQPERLGRRWLTYGGMDGGGGGAHVKPGAQVAQPFQRLCHNTLHHLDLAGTPAAAFPGSQIRMGHHVRS